MAYIGNSPGVASQRVTTAFTATSGQTFFTTQSGYTLGYLDVYHNGVKLVNGEDYTATNGTEFTLTNAANLGDSVECVAFIPRGLSDGYTKTEADTQFQEALVSGSNIKTVNGNDITGSGNIEITTGVNAAMPFYDSLGVMYTIALLANAYLPFFDNSGTARNIQLTT
ncbi:hypothetical protein [Flavobacterium sp.]|jgi:hypothetical protein|uniref:hypothetical protein n=1 Tax=Flavobacterium sp. TaxID=239 RepID=UPI0037BF69D5